MTDTRKELQKVTVTCSMCETDVLVFFTASEQVDYSVTCHICGGVRFGSYRALKRLDN